MTNIIFKYISAFILIILSGYYLLAQHDNTNQIILSYLHNHIGNFFPTSSKEVTSVGFALLDFPSILFIMIGWGIVELLLNSNKTDVPNDTQQQYLALKETENSLTTMIEQIKSQNSEQMNLVYQQLIDSSNPYIHALVKHKKQGMITEDFELEIINKIRNTIHFIEERIQHLSFVSSVLPMFGMVGTLVGLMVMTFQFSHKTGTISANAINANFGAVGLALLTTLYASLVTITFIKPRIQNLKNKLAKLMNRSEATIQKGMQLLDLTEDYFLSAESSETRLTWLQQAYPSELMSKNIKDSVTTPQNNNLEEETLNA